MLFGERVILFRKEKIKIRLLICFEVTNVNILREYLFGYSMRKLV